MSSNGVGSAFKIATRARLDFASGTMLATGKTCKLEPTARSRSASLAARIARSITSGTSGWPNEIVALFKIPPHRVHGGSVSPRRTRSSTGSMGPRQSHCMHIASRSVPCTSMTMVGELPAFW